MRRILVLTPPEDRTGRATALATALARRSSAHVTLLRVLEERLRPSRSDGTSDSERSIRELLTASETTRLEAQAERLRAGGVDASVEIEWGVPWEVVLERVRERGHDLVVKPAAGLSRNGRVFFGYTALHLFRRCPCPVWVVGEAADLPTRVVAAIEPADGERRREIAQAVLDWSERIAEWVDAPLEIVTAWRPVGAELFEGDPTADEWQHHRAAALDRATRAVRALLDTRPREAIQSSCHLVEGAPDVALPAFCEGRPSDLLVMGTQGRADILGDLIGETAETVIRQVRCSVLSVPPDSHPESAQLAGAGPLPPTGRTAAGDPIQSR